QPKAYRDCTMRNGDVRMACNDEAGGRYAFTSHGADARGVAGVRGDAQRAAVSRAATLRGAAPAAAALVRGDDRPAVGFARAYAGARDGGDAHGRVALHL